MNQKAAISKINRHGILLVFPINNRKDPRSLWYEFFPKTRMKWEWDDDGDDKVAGMWHLMKRLSDSRQVVYSKWYQGRATFFSRELYRAMLALLHQVGPLDLDLSRPGRDLLEALEEDSPLSTKILKKRTELQGKDLEPMYNRALRELFSRFLIVAYGEVDDGAFPSLAVGATRSIYEDLWNESLAMSPGEAAKTVDRYSPTGSLTRKYFEKTLALLKPGIKMEECDF